MPKVITYSENEKAFLKMQDGNEYSEGSEEALEWGRADQGQGGKWLRRAVDVRWVKGGHLEIGVAALDPSREMPVEGVFITLDREASNRIIRALRDGRDGAFGKDA